MLYVKEESGEYRPAGKKEVHDEAVRIAKLQHLQPTISDGSALMQYLALKAVLSPIEEFRVIYVNNRNKIIKDEVLSSGIEDQTAVFPKQIVRECLMNYATGVIITHNHPTGHNRPSNADLVITRQLAAACDALSVRLLDHVIVAADDSKTYFSFRENGLL